MNETNNVILFPKTLELLETESFQAIDDQDFKTALEKLDILLAHHVSSYQIHIGKLICLIKLDKLAEAEQFCEDLLRERESKYYYDYFEYYTMILYERNKYSEVMVVIDEEKRIGQIPNEYETKYNQLYEICYHINETTATELLQDLEIAVNEHQIHKQNYIISQWQQLNVRPTKMLFSFLHHHDVHPVVKTNILRILQRHQVVQAVEVEKFGERLTIRPKDLPKMDEHPIYQQILRQMSDIEQENPTLFQLVKELLDQFSDVCYPFFYQKEEVIYVARALIHLGQVNLSLHSTIDDDCIKTNDYIKKIEAYHEIYLKMMLQ